MISPPCSDQFPLLVLVIFRLQGGGVSLRRLSALCPWLGTCPFDGCRPSVGCLECRRRGMDGRKVKTNASSEHPSILWKREVCWDHQKSFISGSSTIVISSACLSVKGKWLGVVALGYQYTYIYIVHIYCIIQFPLHVPLYLRNFEHDLLNRTLGS